MINLIVGAHWKILGGISEPNNGFLLLQNKAHKKHCFLAQMFIGLLPS